MISTISGACRYTLSGNWARTINGRLVDYVHVPGSYRPVGECVLHFNFPLPWETLGNDRLFLVTEGVMANAEISCNGQVLGTAGPWTTYRFEVPTGLLNKENVITARVRDIVESV
ncbi:MAG TPA: hypothetical protein VHV83_07495 [Armatimonadota bacterium]|nr:hypothetical protein [Armatimonadota bacterium]